MARKPSLSPATNPSSPTLWPHQQQTLKFLAKTPRAIDTSDPGTGKTVVHILDFAQRPKATRGRMLVVCPKTLMVPAWGEDIVKFAPELTVAFAFAENRKSAFDTNADVVIINSDGVKWLDDKANVRVLTGFKQLVVDEFTTFKHPTSQRSKAMARLRKHFAVRRILSGTPNPNSVMELWLPAMIVDDGKRLGDSFFKLRGSVQNSVQKGPSPNHREWFDRPGAAQAVNELLADITIRHAFEEVMTHVPPNHRDTKAFELSAKARKLYDKMETDCILAFDDKSVNAVHAAALRTKLLQIASGAVYDGGEDSSYQLIDTTRYELIADMVEDRAHSVVFFNWKHQRDLLQKEFTARKMTFALIDGSVDQRKRDAIVADYQAGKYQTILLHPKTGAHGLTLTRGDTTVFSSPIYEADLMKQGIARIYRGIQDKVTNTVFLEAKNTVEQAVYERLNGKYARMEDLLDLMRARKK